MHYEDMLAREAHRLRLERANEAREQGDMFICEVMLTYLHTYLLTIINCRYMHIYQLMHIYSVIYCIL